MVCPPRPPSDPELGLQPGERLAVAEALLALDQVDEPAADLGLVIEPGAGIVAVDLDRERALGAVAPLRFVERSLFGSPRRCRTIRFVCGASAVMATSLGGSIVQSIRVEPLCWATLKTSPSPHCSHQK